MEKGVVTICVINHKTFDLTRLCLENTRRFTHTPFFHNDAIKSMQTVDRENE